MYKYKAYKHGGQWFVFNRLTGSFEGKGMSAEDCYRRVAHLNAEDRKAKR